MSEINPNFADLANAYGYDYSAAKSIFIKIKVNLL